jgi:hypothetical protein
MFLLLQHSNHILLFQPFIVRMNLDYRYIYILGSTHYPFRYKIGIAKSTENRQDQINKTLRGSVYEIFRVKVFFAHKMEQLLHTIYSPLHAKMYGSGRTEWFWMVFPITPSILLVVILLLQVLGIPFLAAMALYVLRNGLPF